MRKRSCCYLEPEVEFLENVSASDVAFTFAFSLCNYIICVREIIVLRNQPFCAQLYNSTRMISSAASIMNKDNNILFINYYWWFIFWN